MSHSYIKNELIFYCLPYNKHLINQAQSVPENLDLGRVYRPHCIRSVVTTSIKTLMYELTKHG